MTNKEKAYKEGYALGITGRTNKLSGLQNPYWDGDHTDDELYFAWLSGYKKGKEEHDKSK